MSLTPEQMAPAPPPTMTLYSTAGSRAFRILWTLKEMGLTNYKLITMPFPPRFMQKDYLKMNPLGTIPFFIDGDTRMTESCAVPRYLVDKFGPTPLAVLPNEPDYGAYLNWIAHADATLTFPQTVALRYTLQEPDRAPNAAEDYAKWFLARTRLLDAVLADGREFLVAGRFTIADIVITYALNLGKSPRPLHEKYSTQTRNYMERMLARPAYKAAVKEDMESLKMLPKGASVGMTKLTKPSKL